MSIVRGIGLGLRQEFLQELKKYNTNKINFLEISAENWLNIGGKKHQFLEYYANHFPIVCHGLSLSIGSLAPLDMEYLRDLKQFLDKYNITIFSDHLSFCSDEQGMLYDLFPLPFTEEAVKHIVKRIYIVQDILERKISLENISYYYSLDTSMTEEEFILAILQESNCQLLLDVNNVYVNSINHTYDARKFIDAMTSASISYIHVAGHWQENSQLLIDTHGEAVIDPVWKLLDYTYKVCGIHPTLLERDNNIPELSSLLNELTYIQNLQRRDCA